VLAVSDSLHDVPAISETRYEELSVGDRFGPFDESFTRSRSDLLRGPVGTVLPGDGAPPGMLPLVTLRVLRRALRGIIPGGILIHQRFTFHADLPAGADVAVDVRVSAQERRPSGTYTTFTFALAHEGVLAAVVEWTILAPKAPSGQG
jgi:hypothetical protein